MVRARVKVRVRVRVRVRGRVRVRVRVRARARVRVTVTVSPNPNPSPSPSPNLLPLLPVLRRPQLPSQIEQLRLARYRRDIGEIYLARRDLRSSSPACPNPKPNLQPLDTRALEPRPPLDVGSCSQGGPLFLSRLVRAKVWATG